MPGKPLTEDLIREREALEEMQRSEGWRIYCRRVTAEWQGEGYFARMQTALATNDLSEIKGLHRAALEMQRGLTWVQSRIAHLKGQG